MQQEWLIWTLVKSKIATLTELETTWCLDDAERAYAVLIIDNYVTDTVMENRLKK